MSARNEALEKLIAESPDAPDNYLVYADWLSGQGDPRGELITVQHALSLMSADHRSGLPGAPLVDREKAVLEKAQRFLPDIDPEMVHVTWRWGFLESVHFNNMGDWMDGDVDAAGIAARVLASPVAIALSELRIGVMNWDYSERDVPAIVQAAAESPAGRHLRRIHIGDFGEADVDTGMYNPGKLVGFAGVLPALESLVVRGYEFELGLFDLPRLKRLAIETCALTKDHLAQVVGSSWPGLERLELWFGSANYGASCGVGDLGRILEGSAFPRLQHLGLMNAEFADALPTALAGSQVLKTLKTLDLSKGTMGPDGARAMLDARTAFQHLESISVDENFLGEELLEQLREIGPTIISTDQKEDDLSIPGEVHRYVSMHE